ncbi:MAG: pilus assembly protein [Pseudomonadota bacterium]
MIRAIIQRLRRFGRDESGVITVDYILSLPLYIAIFLMSFETSFIMMRQTMLDRGVDLAVREVRLNTLAPPNYDELKEMVCDTAGLISSCSQNLTLEMYQEDPRGTMSLNAAAQCFDREEEVQPATIYEPGAQNQIMFVRACVRYKPVFPSAILAGAIVDANGDYALTSASIYVTEP